MRGVVLSAFLAIGAVSAFAPTPAAARDYPYCLQGRGPGYPGECSYTSYAQCQASASGRNASCGINPRAAYAQRRGGGGYAYDGYSSRGERSNRRAPRDDFFGSNY